MGYVESHRSLGAAETLVARRSRFDDPGLDPGQRDAMAGRSANVVNAKPEFVIDVTGAFQCLLKAVV